MEHLHCITLCGDCQALIFSADNFFQSCDFLGKLFQLFLLLTEGNFPLSHAVTQILFIGFRVELEVEKMLGLDGKKQIEAYGVEPFIAKCKELSFYDTGVTAEYGDKLITLSTCEYSRNNSRLVAVAKRITEDGGADAAQTHAEATAEGERPN